jgi:hypothetical protein
MFSKIATTPAEISEAGPSETAPSSGYGWKASILQYLEENRSFRWLMRCPRQHPNLNLTIRPRPHLPRLHLLDLPNELLSHVTTSLPDEHKLLLSLTRRHFRLLNHSTIDITLSQCDRDTRLRFLAYIEQDYPDKLICRVCAYMFKWSERTSSHYNCPLERKHSQANRLDGYRAFPSLPYSITRECVDLVHRAQELGPSYRYPQSQINGYTFSTRDVQALYNET